MKEDHIIEVLEAVPKEEYHAVYASYPARCIEIWWASNDTVPSHEYSGLARRRMAVIPLGEYLTDREALALGSLFSHSKILAQEVLDLRKENFALSAWQCPYVDGVTGLTSDEHGNQYCAMSVRFSELQQNVAMQTKEAAAQIIFTSENEAIANAKYPKPFPKVTSLTPTYSLEDWRWIAERNLNLYTKLHEKTVRLRDAVAKAQMIFEHYGNLHSEKQNPEKALRNYEYAHEMAMALKELSDD